MNGLAALTKTTTMTLLLGLALHASDAVGQRRMPLGQSQDILQADPGGRVSPRF